MTGMIGAALRECVVTILSTYYRRELDRSHNLLKRKPAAFAMGGHICALGSNERLPP
jgi:hypothetical protein